MADEQYGFGDRFSVKPSDHPEIQKYVGRIGTIAAVDFSDRWTVVELRFAGDPPTDDPIRFLRSELTREVSP